MSFHFAVALGQCLDLSISSCCRLLERVKQNSARARAIDFLFPTQLASSASVRVRDCTRMQSYPPEFTGHHVPLMFVAGLGAAPPASTAGPNGEATSSSSHPVVPPVSSDPFDTLLQSLRRALVSRKSWHVWDNSRGVNHDFHVIAVDKVSSWRRSV